MKIFAMKEVEDTLRNKFFDSVKFEEWKTSFLGKLSEYRDILDNVSVMFTDEIDSMILEKEDGVKFLLGVLQTDENGVANKVLFSECFVCSGDYITEYSNVMLVNIH